MNRFVPLLLVVVAAACGHPARPPAPTAPGALPGAVPAAAPVIAPGSTLPQTLLDYMQSQGWGQMHLQWHTERRWDRLPSNAVAYAGRQGWKRAARQEGEPGNGVEFLAMHRAMMQMLVEKDPSAKPYFTGWAMPPTDPRDANDPLPNGASTAFDPDMLAAIDRLQHHLDSFSSEDELGLYIETSFRPTSGQPETRAGDRTAGVHNYLHNRFQDPSSPTDLGNPSVNLLDVRFWRLHGWIDHVWTSYRANAGLRDATAEYQALMRTARDAMAMKMKGMGTREPPPVELINAVRP